MPLPGSSKFTGIQNKTNMASPGRILAVVIASIFFACSILTVYTASGDSEVTFGDFVYGLLVGGVQAFVPFLLFFTGVNLLLQRLIQKNSRFKILPYQLATALACGLIVLTIMVCFGLYDNSTNFKARGLANNLLDYSLFFVFIPVAILLNYILYSIEHKGHNEQA